MQVFRRGDVYLLTSYSYLECVDKDSRGTTPRSSQVSRFSKAETSRYKLRIMRSQFLGTHIQPLPSISNIESTSPHGSSRVPRSNYDRRNIGRKKKFQSGREAKERGIHSLASSCPSSTNKKSPADKICRRSLTPRSLSINILLTYEGKETRLSKVSQPVRAADTVVHVAITLRRSTYSRRYRINCREQNSFRESFEQVRTPKKLQV